MFRNSMPRYELLSEQAMATLDGGWRRLVSEIGFEFLSDRALKLFGNFEGFDLTTFPSPGD